MSLQTLQVTNSTSYVDVIAIQLGLSRIPGETADLFLDRLFQAAANVRSHTYQGTVDQLSFALGLSVATAMTISAPDPTTLIVSSFGQVSITRGSITTVIPTVKVAADNYWEWRKLSDIVADINSQTSCTAVLENGDGLAWRLGSQTSLNISVAEPVTGTDIQLEHAGVMVGTERFNNVVPAYTLSTAGRLVLSAPAPAGTQVTYVYNIIPLGLAMSQLGVFSLTDPTLKDYAAGADGSLVHQLSEYTSAILSQDPSYWGE